MNQNSHAPLSWSNMYVPNKTIEKRDVCVFCWESYVEWCIGGVHPMFHFWKKTKNNTFHNIIVLFWLPQ